MESERLTIPPPNCACPKSGTEHLPSVRCQGKPTCDCGGTMKFAKRRGYIVVVCKVCGFSEVVR